MVLGGLLASSLAPGGALARSSARGQVGSAAFKDAGTITQVTDGSAADLDGATDQLAASNNVVRNISETLITFPSASLTKYKGVLATSWQAKNGGKTYIVHLRHGVKFHSGRGMTSA